MTPNLRARVAAFPGQDAYDDCVELQIWDGEAYCLGATEIDPTLPIAERVAVARVLAERINREE